MHGLTAPPASPPAIVRLQGCRRRCGSVSACIISTEPLPGSSGTHFLMPSSPLRRLLVSLALLAAVLRAAAEAHRARIRGVVLDPALAGIPDVEVRATREATGDTRRVKTDGRGRFTFPELPPGTSRIVVEHAGYGPFIERAELAMNQEFRLEAALQPGTAVQAVDVTAPFTPVDR